MTSSLKASPVWLKHFLNPEGAWDPKKLLTSCVNQEHRVYRYPPGLGWHTGLTRLHFSSFQETLPKPPNSLASPLPNPSGALVWALSQTCSVFFSTDSPLTRVGCTSPSDCTELSCSQEFTAVHSEEEQTCAALLPSSSWAPATGTGWIKGFGGQTKVIKGTNALLIGRTCSPTLQPEEQYWNGCASWDSQTFSPRGYTNLQETTAPSTCNFTLPMNNLPHQE